MKLIKKLSLLSLACALNTSFANECCDPCHSYFVRADYLYWQPTQAGMTYAFSSSTVGSLSGSDNKEVQQKSSWGSGFRLSLGYDKEEAPCDFSLSWTRFHHTSHSSNNDPFILGTQLLGPENPFTVGGSASSTGDASSKWNVALDVIELDMGYAVVNNACYTLRPYLGVVAARIHQSQTILYNHFLDTSNATFFDATIKQKNDFDGIGPKLGMLGEVGICRGFTLMGNLAASFYYGNSKNPVESEVVGDPVGFPNPNYATSYKKQRIVPSLQGQLGLTWSAMNREKFSLELGALYEVQCFMEIWRNQSSQIQNLYIADAGYQSLMLNGFTGYLRVNF